MPKQEGQKSKLLALLRIFEQQTDENHLLNVPQLVELLEAQGIRCERKSVYSDIEALGALGYDIKLRRGRGGGYFLASRTFDLAELKLLVDAVQASRVVSGTTSRRLIHKLEKLCSNYEGSQLQRQVYVEGRPKTDSKSLLYSIDALHEAINNGKMVEFLYRKADSREKEKRTVSPWQLAWENGCYYLIAFADEKGIRHYRVDKMSGVRVLDAPRRGQEQFADLDLPAYLRKHFGMYGGPEHRVTLRCTADLEGAMRERFGATPMFLPEENGCFHFDVPICVSDQFYGWVCGFGGKIEVVAPPEVRQGRFDLSNHLWANVQTLSVACDAGVNACILDEKNKIWVTNKSCVLKKSEAYGPYLSVFSLEGEIYDFSLEGTKWPLNHHDLMPCDSLTVSNQFVDDEVKISFVNGRIVIMETKD